VPMFISLFRDELLTSALRTVVADADRHRALPIRRGRTIRLIHRVSFCPRFCSLGGVMFPWRGVHLVFPWRGQVSIPLRASYARECGWMPERSRNDCGFRALRLLRIECKPFSLLIRTCSSFQEPSGVHIVTIRDGFLPPVEMNV
jgi:hypothetical protein